MCLLLRTHPPQRNTRKLEDASRRVTARKASSKTWGAVPYNSDELTEKETTKAIQFMIATIKTF